MNYSSGSTRSHHCRAASEFDDCIAITQWTDEGDYLLTLEIRGQGGDDVIVAAEADSVNVEIDGGEGDDDCTSFTTRMFDCELTYTY